MQVKSINRSNLLYKANAHKDFKLGSLEFWEMSKILIDDEMRRHIIHRYLIKKDPELMLKKISGK